jgi:hypothetical protein
LGAARAQIPPSAEQAAPPPPSVGPVVAPPPQIEAAPSQSAPVDEARPTPEAPKGPPRPERRPVAVLRILDKVTAETLRFAAPVGRRVRYKNLVFEVKACEIWGIGTAQPRPSAYVIISSDPGGADAGGVSQQIYKGWMFAEAPGAHLLRHPIYDAWLESCIASAPGI